MKVLAISGSARRDGNTAALIDVVFEELEKAGIECELVQLAESDIHGCHACWGCGARGNCVFKNDAFC